MTTSTTTLCKRSDELAERLTRGAESLEAFAAGLTEEEWRTPVKGDGRTVGVVVHHVASAYPVEIELARVLASGQPIVDATKEAVDKMNADHAREFADAGKPETLALLRNNSRAAAEAVRAFTHLELENAGTVALNSDAPLTAQFFIEDHALRHSYHHLAGIRKTLKR